MSATIPQYRILIVDDEPNIVLAIEFLMKQAGYEVAKAYNGLEALEKVNEFKPHLIILDVMMPHMDGFEVARTLRQDDSYFNTKIIFLTAQGTDRDMAKGYGSGGDIYLTKPFDNKELTTIVQEITEYELN
ncbi:MAG: response regulator [Bacteroidia bacterium]|nr:response regulator [Bacteroidia bacterium]